MGKFSKIMSVCFREFAKILQASLLCSFQHKLKYPNLKPRSRTLTFSLPARSLSQASSPEPFVIPEPTAIIRSCSDGPQPSETLIPEEEAQHLTFFSSDVRVNFVVFPQNIRVQLDAKPDKHDVDL